MAKGMTTYQCEVCGRKVTFLPSEEVYATCKVCGGSMHENGQVSSPKVDTNQKRDEKNIGERGIKEYFGNSFGVNEKEKQDFESSMKNVASFMTNGLANFKKKTGRGNDEQEVEEYRKLAEDAYDEKSYSEARQYYRKILEINPNDYDAIFFERVCGVLCSSPNKDNMSKSYEAYINAKDNIPIEYDWHIVEEKYAFQMANLVLAWHKIIQNRKNQHLADWYEHNLSIYYECCDLAEIAISYMDECMPIILKSDLPDYNKEWNYAWQYCRMCDTFCDSTLYYKTTNRDLAITSSRYCGPLGYPFSKKEYVIKKYDDMCFEVRKFSKNFEVCGIVDECGLESNEYGFDRMDPPTTYENQQTRNRLTRLAQMSKDREIAEKVAKWRSSGGKEKEAREKRFFEYMSSHSTERTEYQKLKREKIAVEREVADLEKSISSLKMIVVQKQKNVTEIYSNIARKKEQIVKLENKIFGKAKAQLEIEIIREEINKQEVSLAKSNAELDELKTSMSLLI